MRDVVVRYRRALVIAVHIALWTLSYFGAFLLRFELEIPSAYFRDAPVLLGTLLAIRTAVHWRLGLFHGLWRYSRNAGSHAAREGGDILYRRLRRCARVHLALRVPAHRDRARLAPQHHAGRRLAVLHQNRSRGRRTERRRSDLRRSHASHPGARRRRCWRDADARHHARAPSQVSARWLPRRQSAQARRLDPRRPRPRTALAHARDRHA